MKQETALDILKMGYNVYLTGPAGSGKTYLLDQYIKYLKKNKIGVAVTASTGFAATHLKGRTIHSWSGMGIKNELSKKDLGKFKRNFNLRRRMAKTKVLIIDEISMLHAYQLDIVDQICRLLKDTHFPFGGLQVVLSGDFFQLPPVSRGEDKKNNFILKSDAWDKSSFKICYLDKIYRQKNNQLTTILNEIREGNISNKSFELIISREDCEIEGIKEPTKLFTHNVNVDDLNQSELEKLKAKPFVYEMQSRGNEKLIENLKSGCLTPEELTLKREALVMFVKNNFSKGYANGTVGEVVSFNRDKMPIVKIKSGKKIIADRETWTIEENGKVIASVKQVPLRLAWAITVHKSQGMSLDAVEIDLSKSFSFGMGYVALSRACSLEGIKLLGINDLALKVNPLIIKVDKLLQLLSRNTEKKFENMGKLRKWSAKNNFLKKIKN